MPLPAEWLEVAHYDNGIVLHDYSQCWHELELPATSVPSLVVAFGQKCKSTWLQSVVTHHSQIEPHGKVLLRRDRSRRSNIFIDYELDYATRPKAAESSGCDRPGSTSRRSIQKLPSDCNIANLFLGRVLGIFAEVLCFFAPDLGGIPGVAALLGEQIAVPGTPRSDFEDSRLHAHILVVCTTTAASFDCNRAKSKLLGLVERHLREHASQDLPATLDFHDWIESRLGPITVTAVSRQVDEQVRTKTFRNAVEMAQRRVRISRQSAGVRFRRDHFHALLESCIESFCHDCRTPFSFASRSRPVGFDLRLYEHSVLHFLDLKPHNDSNALFAARVSDRESDGLVPDRTGTGFHAMMLASAAILSCYPPGSHLFPMPWLYKQLFEVTIHKALMKKLHNYNDRQCFRKGIESQVQAFYQNLLDGQYRSAKHLHSETLLRFRAILNCAKANSFCLLCLLDTPEKCLPCGHSLCDTCIRIWSEPSTSASYCFTLLACPLCGASKGTHDFRLLPPTAGIRLLSLDGGGVRGVVPLVILSEIERRLEPFGAPLRHYFDYVCGTSAGGLVAIGLFLMEWRAAHCLDIFKTLATKTFGGSSVLPLFKIQQVLISWLRDWRFSATAIEDAFRPKLAQNRATKDESMFRSITDSVRVAVATTVTAKQPDTCLLSNYNGGHRQERRSYKLFRPMESIQGVSIGQAARATSAAPWLFAPISIPGLGFCQDGGLNHNNPIHLADWEAKAMWGDRGLRDFELSIGTGYSEGVFRPARGFLRRVIDSFMYNMDGEKIHEKYMNSRSLREKERIHRFNINIGPFEPSIHDLASMSRLEEQALSTVHQGNMVTTFHEIAIASMFCFELDAIPTREISLAGNVFWRCTGHIFCRLQLPRPGLKKLLQDLRDTRSHFLISEGLNDQDLEGTTKSMPKLLGQPHMCIGGETNDAGPYRRWISFCLASMDSSIGITLSGITSQPRSISGLPQTARTLVKAQGLYAPFGRSDHRREKSLPSVPTKRKHYEMS